MDNKQLTYQLLCEKGQCLYTKNVVVGLDGFVDRIVHPVDKRHGQGDDFQAMSTIACFGNRVLAAAGKSANIELSPRFEKLGGNGPIMANAVASLGAKMRYIGALGEKSINPVFADFARMSDAVSVADPGVTLALEFDDGKLMLGIMASLEKVTYERILSTMGEGAFMDTLNQADLICLVNWTMLPNMTSIFKSLLDKALPALKQKDRAFFFDLADPAKRSEADLKEVLALVSRFEQFGRVTLGLNLAEAQQIAKVMGYPPAEHSTETLKALVKRLRKDLDLDTVVVHPTDSAACATRTEVQWVAGPYVEKPKITTGAGDHFNAGFAMGQLMGLPPAACLTTAVCTSGFYVRTAKSPTIEDLTGFLQTWK